MVGKTVSTRGFNQDFLSLIDEVKRTHAAITILDSGKPVARLVPIANDEHADPSRPVIGGLKGSVLRYEDPFSPVTDLADWESAG